MVSATDTSREIYSPGLRGDLKGCGERAKLRL